MKPILTANAITKSYPGEAQVLKGTSLCVLPGTFTALLGASGSGKSTLLHILSGLLKPDSGSVTCAGTEITNLSAKQLSAWKRECSGIIFQNYLLLEHLTIRENIEIGKTSKKDPLAFDPLIAILGLENVLHKFPAQLSGGQKQRAAIARAVIKKPEILFCDEATGALDEDNGNQVVAMLHHLKSTYGITILFVTHNQSIAATADDILTIRDGVCVDTGTERTSN